MTQQHNITQQTIRAFFTARKGEGDVVLCEGVHALKHARRFGAEIVEMYVRDDTAIEDLFARILLPEERAFFLAKSTRLLPEDFAKLSPVSIRTGMIARVKKGRHHSEDIADDGLVVALEHPRDLGNIGAVIRASAARGVAGVITIGDVNPWHAHVLRGAAGLHFAQPIVALKDTDKLFASFAHRPIIACSDEGESMYDLPIASDSVLLFGTERDGILPSTKQRADSICAIPMQDGVSSMNLATSVSAILFGHRRKGSCAEV